MFKNEMTERLMIQYPIIQAPMAGGITTSKLVAEVSNSGALGMIGAGYMTPMQMRKQISEMKELTSNSFGINLFVPAPFDVKEKEIERANQLLEPIREELHIQEEPVKIPDYNEVQATFHEQLKVVIDEQVPICSFTFGIPSKEIIETLKQHDVILLGTATTVQEAIEVEKSGMDLVVVQGSEAGGHRGNFLDGHQESLVGLMSLIPQVADQVTIPVVSAGGIMDGRGLTASLYLGAQGVQMGTAFLTCLESGANERHKEEILHAKEDQIVLTRSFSGKYARGIKNKFISDMEPFEDSFPPFPVQNTLTQNLRRAASSQQNRDSMSLWSGQSPRLAKKQSVKALIQNVVAKLNNFNH
ncbi:NAD(P)H-dependent flavin oxidoreductase [Mesobacillus maritimus]|uniref:Probable nitronate monooxygenase n=1 Tax=Mesobacillus maritimus TaxID=1643336 RepID=A0ABS7K776_9BACI|nr:nitronate monooxygenase [Mesobacillus maritimus]MBY0098128.1 nitronate monooxygenase [Mesobacillus maritimus]